MKKFIIPIICYSLILVVLFNYEKITDFLAKILSNNEVLTIEDGNEYTKNYDFLFVKNSKDYIPYSYNDLIDIIYSIANQGWREFTFYCPNEYENCIDDFSKLIDDELILTHINNFVHPYNSFEHIKSYVSESGEITIKMIRIMKILKNFITIL